MATYVKGDAVENATSYELFEKTDDTYTSLGEASEINFEVSALGLAGGDHVLVVKAKADGYTDSAYSNEVTYSVETETLPTFTISPTPTDATVVLATPSGNQTDNSINVIEGNDVYWRVSADGYYPQSGKYTVSDDYTESVELTVAEVDLADISSELEWTCGTTISSSGVATANQKYAATSMFDVSNYADFAALVVNDLSTMGYSWMCATYDSDGNFIERLSGSGNSYRFALGSSVKSVKLLLGYSSASGIESAITEYETNMAICYFVAE